MWSGRNGTNQRQSYKYRHHRNRFSGNAEWILRLLVELGETAGQRDHTVIRQFIRLTTRRITSMTILIEFCTKMSKRSIDWPILLQVIFSASGWGLVSWWRQPSAVPVPTRVERSYGRTDDRDYQFVDQYFWGFSVGHTAEWHFTSKLFVGRQKSVVSK